MGYNLLINGIYRGYNLFTNHLLSSWDIQATQILFSLHSYDLRQFLDFIASAQVIVNGASGI